MKRTLIALSVVTLSVGGLYLWRSRTPPSAPPMAAAPPPQTSVAPQPLTASPEPPPQPDPAPATQAAPPKVDIVFAVDTTGSMGSLLDGAKAKIWEIARMAQQGKPSPQLRVGLVAYRDRGDAYVTKVFDLTRDMDAVYAHLSDLRAEGGGDTPEHVLKGLHDAIDAVHWSDDASALKLTYLVGDAPPHMDYGDGITLDGVVKDAIDKGVRISAIRCGNDPQTLAAWTEIARRTDGDVSTIAQGGGVATVATPYDAELARLNAALSRTEIHYGTAAERRAADDSVARGLAAPAAAQASRASFYGTLAAAKAAPIKKDLSASSSPAPLASVAPAELPDEMQTMTDDERVSFVARQQAARTAILTQVAAESAKRDAYLKRAGGSDVSFDAKVYDSLKKAGAAKKIAF